MDRLKRFASNGHLAFLLDRPLYPDSLDCLHIARIAQMHVFHPAEFQLVLLGIDGAETG